MKIKPTHPIISYIGGKTRTADKIINRFPTHHCYCEVFAGGLSVMMKKPISKNEVANDYDAELINLYKVTKFRLGDLLDGLKDIPLSRRLWEDFMTVDPMFLNPITRAVRKLYILRLSFGGRGRNYGTNALAPVMPKESLREWLILFQERMRSVTIECLDANVLIKKYDKKSTFFYIDPAYINKDFYKQKFGGLERMQFLRDTLNSCKGKWLLSHHDCPEIRELFQKFKFQKIAIRYTYRPGDYHKKTSELLISNY